VYNQSLNEHICLECERGIGLKRKPFGFKQEDLGGELPLLDNDFDTLDEIELFLEKSESN
jgi:hypothetical protein